MLLQGMKKIKSDTEPDAFLVGRLLAGREHVKINLPLIGCFNVPPRSGYRVV